MRPIICGGGIAGLTAGLRLAQRGLQPLILEAEQVVGGRLRDEEPVVLEHQGQRWSFPQEHGVHGLWGNYVNFKQFLQSEQLVSHLTPAENETWVLGRGEQVLMAHIGRTIRQSWVPAPFHYLQLFVNPRFLRLLTIGDWASLLRVSAGLFAALAIDPLTEQKPLKEMSLADFTEGWSANMRGLFAGLARNSLAVEPHLAPAAGFIAFLRFYTLFQRSAWAFDYLPAGGGAVCEGLVSKIQQLGGEVITQAKVVQLVQAHPAGWQLTFERGGEWQTHFAPEVVLALSAPAAKQLLLSSPDTAEAAAQRHFPQGIATAIIRLWFGRQPTVRTSESGMFSGNFAIHNFFWLDRLHASYQAWAKATGGSALETHIYGSPELFNRPDAFLLAEVAQEVHRVFPELRPERLHMHVQRNPATHTLFSLGYPEENVGVNTGWPQLFACGDWVFDPIPALYLERAVTTALLAANELLTGRGQEPFPVLPYPAPEPTAKFLASFWGWVRKKMQRRKGVGNGE